MAVNIKDLVVAIKVALPLLSDDRMLFLMQELGVKGVRCKADMKKLEAADLVNALGTKDAKRLVAFFRTPELSDDIITDGARFLDPREPIGSAEKETMFENAWTQGASDHLELLYTVARMEQNMMMMKDMQAMQVNFKDMMVQTSSMVNKTMGVLTDQVVEQARMQREILAVIQKAVEAVTKRN
ncbi:uncharacterized protein [Dermacentor albipictus]|uniref:uncharacterized protein n=1 Tax=Dermacentor albipictus TaxID=60249 RepID=UPI0038FC6F6B